MYSRAARAAQALCSQGAARGRFERSQLFTSLVYWAETWRFAPGAARGYCRCCGSDAVTPVLKHGPRSLTDVRVRRWQTSARNESEGREPQGAAAASPWAHP